jgi:hypothetical protein
LGDLANQQELTWEQELLAKGEAIGEARDEARGQAQGELKAYRKMLRKRLERRFAPLPEALLQKIDAAELPALEAAVDQADAVQSLDESSQVLERRMFMANWP